MQLDRLAGNIAGLYGELEALLGSALPAVELLELRRRGSSTLASGRPP
jgi:hypothetical protein